MSEDENEGTSKAEEKENPTVEDDTIHEDVLSDEDDDNELFKKLMQKVQDAGMLEEEISSNLSNLSDRVEDVIDSVDRIEKIERPSLANMAFKDGEENKPMEVGQEPVEKPAEPEVVEDPGETVFPSIYDKASIGQMQILTTSPYEEVGKGGYHPDEESQIISHYSSEANSIISNFRRLIMLKLDKGNKEEAMDLFNMARSIGGSNPTFADEFSSVMSSLGIENNSSIEVSTMIPEETETKVLDPDLAEGIDILEKKARSALEQLNSMMDTSNLSKAMFNSVKENYVEAKALFKEKRFHKSHQIALEGFKTIKDKVHDDLDNMIQDTLYRVKEMIEEMEKSKDHNDPALMDELKGEIDIAMKAYLTNEYEKADLLSKKVMNKVLEIQEPDAAPLLERAKEIRTAIDTLIEKNILHEEIADISSILKSADQLIKRKDRRSATKILDQISPMLEELRKKAETYVAAREIEIKLTNRIQRMDETGHDVEEPKRKLSHIKNYLKDDRYDDVLIIGEELEKELSSKEYLNDEIEIRSMLEDIKKLIEGVAELDEDHSFNDRYDQLIEQHEKGITQDVLKNGNELINELKARKKTLNVERGKRIAIGVINIKILTMKMRSMNLDPTEMERRSRNIKARLKVGDYFDGLKELDQLVHDLKKTINGHLVMMKKLTSIHRDSLEVVMDRHRDQPVIFHIKNRHIPVLRKMEDLGRFRSAIDGYRKLGNKFSGMILPEDRKNLVETELTECKFEIYKRKEEGLDISEPLSLYTNAQKIFSSGDVVPAEFLVEISKRYCDQFLPRS